MGDPPMTNAAESAKVLWKPYYHTLMREFRQGTVWLELAFFPLAIFPQGEPRVVSPRTIEY